MKALIIFFFIFSILTVIKELFVLFVKMLESDRSEIHIGRQIAFGLAVSYIITMICTNFTI